MAIEYKQPAQADIETMKEFATVIDQGLTLVSTPCMAHVSHIIAMKLQEALQWFSHGVLNKPVVEDALSVAGVVADATGNATLATVVEVANEINSAANAAAPTTTTNNVAS